MDHFVINYARYGNLKLSIQTINRTEDTEQYVITALMENDKEGNKFTLQSNCPKIRHFMHDAYPTFKHVAGHIPYYNGLFEVSNLIFQFLKEHKRRMENVPKAEESLQVKVLSNYIEKVSMQADKIANVDNGTNIAENDLLEIYDYAESKLDDILMKLKRSRKNRFA